MSRSSKISRLFLFVNTEWFYGIISFFPAGKLATTFCNCRVGRMGGRPPPFSIRWVGFGQSSEKGCGSYVKPLLGLAFIRVSVSVGLHPPLRGTREEAGLNPSWCRSKTNQKVGEEGPDVWWQVRVLTIMPLEQPPHGFYRSDRSGRVHAVPPPLRRSGRRPHPGGPRGLPPRARPSPRSPDPRPGTEYWVHYKRDFATPLNSM